MIARLDDEALGRLSEPAAVATATVVSAIAKDLIRQGADLALVPDAVANQASIAAFSDAELGCVTSHDLAVWVAAHSGAATIIELAADLDRSQLAALVTLGLAQGAIGFVTSSPNAVRRAAHVIRAIEHAQ